MTMRLLLAVSFVMLVSLTGRLPAAPIATVDLGTYHSGGFGGVAADPVTGNYYSRPGYGPGFGSGSVTVYNNASDFQNQISSGSIALQNGGYYGTYFAVNNGQLFGRPLGVPTFGYPSDASASRWNLGTGNITATTMFAGMGGVNGTHTFDWGGFSGVNWFQDSTGLYVFGRDLVGSNWQLIQVDQNMNVLQVQSFNPGTSPGYAFMINGNLFLADDFYSLNITQQYNFATNTLTAVNFNLTGIGGFPYIDNVAYDYVNDALYFSNANNGHVYLVADAAQQFNVAAVPEPASLAIWGLTMAGPATAGWRRRWVSFARVERE